MPWGGCSFLVNADEFVTEAEIKELAAAGADAIVPVSYTHLDYRGR